MKINIGIEEKDRKEIAQDLSKLLADSYALYLKTQNFHWNVKGTLFKTLHLMFEEQYTDLASAVDLIAERIRTLGYTAPGSFQEFGRLTSIKEAVGPVSAREMIFQQMEGQEILIKSIRSCAALAKKYDDESTADLMTQRLQAHEKAAWMLRSLIEE